MTTTAPAKCTFRKTRDGEWVVYGPAPVLREAQRSGMPVLVHKRSGQAEQRWIDSVGRAFTADGAQMAYGYIGEVPLTAAEARQISARTTHHATVPQQRSSTTGRGGICDECDRPRRNLVDCLDSSGIGGRCCPTCAAQPAYARSFA